MKMSSGDLEPDLGITLDFDATAATAIRIIGTRRGLIAIDRAPSTTTIVGNETFLTMIWQSGETGVGRITFEVEVMWPGDRPQTIKVLNAVDIEPDVDVAQPSP